MLQRLIFSLLFIFCSISAMATLSPSISTYHGRIITPSTLPLENNNVTFKLQVISPGPEACVLYEEDHTKDMTGSEGLFSLNVGQGIVSLANPGIGLPGAISNNAVFNTVSYPTLSCGTGSSYTPASGDTRKLRVTFNYSGSGGPVTVSPDITMNASPYTMYASSIEGLGKDDLLQVKLGSGYVLNQANLDAIFTATNYPLLISAIDGTHSAYAKTSDLPISGGVLNLSGGGVRVSDTPATSDAAVNQNYTDGNLGGSDLDVTGVGPAVGDGYVISWDQATETWVASAAGTVDNTKLPLAGGTMTGSINMGNNNILGAGHITMSPLTTINLGTYTAAEETTLIATPLGAADKGKTWFNSTTNLMMYWDGTAAVSAGSDATKLPLAGGTMTGAINMGGENVLATGHITMSPQTTLNLGTYTNAEEATLIASPLAGIDQGKTWYNSDTDLVMVWDGTAAVSSGVQLGTSVGTAMEANALPNCTASQKIQASLGPTYSWTCVSESGDIEAITAGNGLVGTSLTSGTPSLDVNVDDATIEVAADVVRIKDGGVTNVKLAAGAVTGAKILNGTITKDDLNISDIESGLNHDNLVDFVADEHIAHSGVSITAGNGLSGGGNIAASRNLAVNVDDSTIEINADTLQVKDLGVSTAKLAASAVTSAKIDDGTIATIDLADTSVTDAKINDVGVDKITSGVGKYFTYAPNNAVCANNEILKWVTANLRWECAADGDTSDHGALGGLLDDDHTQYVMLVGRAGGQTVNGSTDASENLILDSTSHATKGDVILSPTDGNVGIGDATPETKLDIAGTLKIGNGLEVCDGTAPAGMIRYSGGLVEYCDGTATGWQALGTENGDITAVNTNSGSGLSGGAASGDATLQIVVDDSTVEIATNTIQVKDSGITSAKIANGTIALADMGSDSVNSANIVVDSIVAVDIATGAVASDEILDESIVSADIDDGTIATADLADTSVTDAKISDVGVDKITSGAGKYFTYLPNNTACADGEILSWDNTNTRWECAADDGITDHGALGGLLDDDHTQYVLLAGRATGQTLNGGIAASENLTLDSTSHATKGDIILNPTSGNVGVGTTSPDQEVHIFKDGSAAELKLQTTADVGSPRISGYRSLGTNAAKTALTNGNVMLALLGYGYDGTSDSQQSSITLKASETWNGSSKGTKIHFNTTENGTVLEETKMTILGSGNVGIGTASPNNVLEITGADASRAVVAGKTNPALGDAHEVFKFGYSYDDRPLRLLHEYTSGGLRHNILSSNLEYDGTTWTQGLYGGSSAIRLNHYGSINFYNDPQISIGSKDTLAPTPSMIISSSGSVGIGSVSPNTRLEVAGSIRIGDGGETCGATYAGSMRYNSSTIQFCDGSSWLTISSTGAGDNLGNHTATTNIQLGSNYLSGDGDSEGIYVTAAGQVGVGITTPQGALDVNDAGIGLMIGAGAGDTRTNLTEKNARIAMPHYLNAEEPIALIRGRTASGLNTVEIGGGTGILNAATSIRFFTANNSTTTTGSERMVIKNNGDVGIGTASPGEKLEISGSSSAAIKGEIVNLNSNGYSEWLATNDLDQKIGLGIYGSAEPTYGVIGSGEGYLYTAQNLAIVAENKSIKFSTKNSAGESMRITPDGNVGVGTTSPVAKFDLVKDSGIPNATASDPGNYIESAAFRIRTSFSGGGNGLTMGVDDTSGTRTSWIQSGHMQTANANLASSSELLLQPVGGRVGIGSVSPNTRLEVAGSIRIGDGGETCSVSFTGAMRYNSSTIQFCNGSSWLTMSSTGAGDNLGNHTATTNIQLGSNYLSGDGDNEGVYVTAAGQVGVGTTSPTGDLTISDVTSGYPALFVSGKGESELDLAVPAGEKIQFGTHDGTLNGGSTKMIITDAGNVGIGTTAPSGHLHVFGGIGDATLIIEADSDNSDENDNPEIIFEQDGGLQMGRVGLGHNQMEFISAAGSNQGFRFAISPVVGNFSTPTDVMNISSSGQVGVGTTSPLDKLHVYGPMRLGRTGADHSLASDNEDFRMFVQNDLDNGNPYGTNDNSAIIFENRDHNGLNPDDGIYFFNTGSDDNPEVALSMAGNGNVGIGTTTPGEKLEVNGSVYVNSENSIMGADAGAQSRLGFVKKAGIGPVISSGSSSHIMLGSWSTPSLRGNISSGTYSEHMRVTNSGDVGIGVTDPQQKLQVNGNIYLGNNSTTNSYIHSGLDLGLQADSEVRIVSDVNDTSGVGATDIIFGYGSSTNTDTNTDFTQAELGTYPRVELMRIDSSSGNIGIGTSSPNGVLHISKDSDPQFFIENTGDNSIDRNVSLRFRHSTGLGATITGHRWSGNSDGMNLRFATEPVGGSLTDRMIIRDNGNVGIGTTAPAAKLHVDGSGAGGGLCVTSDNTCGAVPTGGEISAETTLNTGADYAEYFEAEESLLKGDLVGLNTTSGKVRGYQPGDQLLGVVSTDPGVIGNSELRNSKTAVLVALVGQVPVLENRVKEESGIVFTKDGETLGYRLSNGNVYLNLSSGSATLKRKIAAQDTEINSLKESKKSQESKNKAQDSKIVDQSTEINELKLRLEKLEKILQK